jgi:long-subunit fatty acid transport protein
MKKLIIIMMVCLFSITSVNKLTAQNYNDAYRLSETQIITNAKSLGTGNAFTAMSNGFNGALFNPAGFALVKKSEMTFSLNYDQLGNDIEFFNSTNKVSDNRTDINQIGVVLPFNTRRGSFAINFGYTKLADYSKRMNFEAFNPNSNSMIQDLTSFNDDIAFNLVLSYPVYNGNDYLYDETKINGKLNQRGNIKQSGELTGWTMGFGIEIAPDLFFGGNLKIIRGSFERNRNYWEEDTQNIYGSTLVLDPLEPRSADFQSFYFNDLIKWDIDSKEWKFGLLAKMNPNLNVGLTVKLPQTYLITEDYNVNAESKFGTGATFYQEPIENRVKYKIRLPYEFRAGASSSFENFTINADVQLIDHAKIEFTEGFNNSNLNSKNEGIEDNLESVVNLYAGLEYKMPGTKTALRIGGMYLPSAYIGDGSEFAKKIITIGVGHKLNNSIEVDAAYAYGWWKDVGDNYSSNLSRTFQSLAKNYFTASLKYLF